MKLKICVSGILTLALTAALAIAADLTADGILGFKWGESLKDNPGVTELYTMQNMDTAYSLDDQPTAFWGLDVNQVTLWCCQGHLVAANIEFIDPSSIPAARNKLTELLGQPQVTCDGRRMAWNKDGLRAKADAQSNSIYIAYDPARYEFCPRIPEKPRSPLHTPIDK